MSGARWTPGERRRLATGLLWISPWLIGVTLFTLTPAALSAYYSFTDFGLLDSPVFIGFDNYRELLRDPLFFISIRNTAVYAAASSVGSTVISLAVAALLDRGLRGAALVRAIVFLPTLVPVVSASVCWLWLYNSQFGLINSTLRAIGVEGPDWLGGRSTAMAALVIMSFWSIGGPLLVAGAALREVPQSLYEAADLDGLTGLRRFFAVTLPLVSPAVLFNGVMALIWSLQVFAPPFIMTKGGPENATQVYAVYTYLNAFTYGRMGYACALAWVQVVATLFVVGLLLAFARRVVYYRAEA